VLDGSDVDSGTAAEIGYAFAQKKKIFGYRSDFRLAADNEGAMVNLQVEYFICASGGDLFTQVSQLGQISQQPLYRNECQQTAAAYQQSPSPPSATAEALKPSNRSILDAFTIFPFAIVLALALGEAFKVVISEDKFIEWSKLYALASFLLLILPFYQGMNKYLLITYGEFADSPKPNSGYLIIDGMAFMAESALFFVMSRTLRLDQWIKFYSTTLTLLAVDSAWGVTVRLHSHTQAKLIVENWTILNVVAIVFLVALLFSSKSEKISSHPYIPAALGTFGMLLRTICDYRISWDFYFPNL